MLRNYFEIILLISILKKRLCFKQAILSNYTKRGRKVNKNTKVSETIKQNKLTCLVFIYLKNMV